MLKSDTVAVLALLPRYPRYYRGNGYNFYGITAVLGPKCTGFPWGQTCGTTVAMGFSFLTCMKISGMRMQRRMYIISFTM